LSGERRKNARLGLAIPARVQGYTAEGSTWEEFATTDDVSLGGACFPLAHDVELGQILFLTLALPKRLRQYDLHDASYRVYTLVRSVRRRPDQHRVGVMYFGKYPPRGFHDRPGARYLLPSDSPGASPDESDTTPETAAEPPTPTPAEGQAPVSSPSPPAEPPPPFEPPDLLDALPDEDGARGTPPPSPGPATPTPPVSWGTDPEPEPRPGVPPAPTPAAPTIEFHPSREVPEDRRASPRMQMWVNFTIEQVDEWGQVLQEELTVADNVSRGGARVMTTLTFQVNDVILVQEAGGGFATRAEVRAITRVQPTTERLHLKFLDRQAPDRLLRQ
jgi:hypothetical protein